MVPSISRVEVYVSSQAISLFLLQSSFLSQPAVIKFIKLKQVTKAVLIKFLYYIRNYTTISSSTSQNRCVVSKHRHKKCSIGSKTSKKTSIPEMSALTSGIDFWGHLSRKMAVIIGDASLVRCISWNLPPQNTHQLWKSNQSTCLSRILINFENPINQLASAEY